MGWDVGFGVRGAGRGSGPNPPSTGAACASRCGRPEHLACSRAGRCTACITLYGRPGWHVAYDLKYYYMSMLRSRTRVHVYIEWYKP